jgi:hypothetical protein
LQKIFQQFSVVNALRHRCKPRLHADRYESLVGQGHEVAHAHIRAAHGTANFGKSVFSQTLQTLRRKHLSALAFFKPFYIECTIND